MAYISGFAVSESDKVWDVLLGWGIVHNINSDGSFRVRFGNDMQIYQPGGRRGSSRSQRLFWQDITQIEGFSPGRQGVDEIGQINALLRFIRMYAPHPNEPAGETGDTLAELEVA